MKTTYIQPETIVVKVNVEQLLGINSQLREGRDGTTPGQGGDDDEAGARAFTLWEDWEEEDY